MSIIYKCDRCGSFFEKRPKACAGVKIPAIWKHDGLHPLDICGDCMIEFGRWFERIDFSKIDSIHWLREELIKGEIPVKIVSNEADLKAIIFPRDGNAMIVARPDPDVDGNDLLEVRKYSSSGNEADALMCKEDALGAFVMAVDEYNHRRILNDGKS